MNARTADVIRRLQAGETLFEHRESGNSMEPVIRHQQPVTLAPVDPSLLEPGDIVLVKVRGRIYTHRVLALRKDEVQIGNNKGGVNGWTGLHHVYGIVTHVDGIARSGAAAKVRTGPVVAR